MTKVDPDNIPDAPPRLDLKATLKWWEDLQRLPEEDWGPRLSDDRKPRILREMEQQEGTKFEAAGEKDESQPLAQPQPEKSSAK